MSYLRQRAEEILLEEQKFQSLLNRGYSEVKNKKRQKKRKLRYSDINENEELEHLVCRDKTLFKAKSHNKDKQKEEYFTYLYFQYDAPKFLIEKIKSNQLDYDNHMQKNIFGDITFLQITETVATGGSLRKLLKDYLNKKEVHLLLNSKQSTLSKALLEVRGTYLGLNKNTLDFLLEKTTFFYNPISEINKEIIKYTVKHDIKKNTLNQLLDYFNASLNNDVNLKTFFKRSLDNMIKDSDEWHVLAIFKASKGSTKWDKLFDDFKYENNDEIFEIKEIITAKQLSQEGSAMRHCVGSYANACAKGRSSILSLKLNEERLVTIEINKQMRRIVQVKGKFNRDANSKELHVLSIFARLNNLTMSQHL